MSTQKNLITLCFATVFALGLAACGGGGGGDAPVTGMMDGDGSMDGDGPELTELATVQADAATAATNARTAATDAQVAADAADTARANRAAIQTGDLHGGNSGAHAMYAQGHADDADTAATNAETASAAAAEATTVRAATTALVAAETALTAATTAKGKAEGSRDEAVTASGKEVKVVDKTKTCRWHLHHDRWHGKLAYGQRRYASHRLGERDGGQGSYHARYEGCPRTAGQVWRCRRRCGPPG